MRIFIFSFLLFNLASLVSAPSWADPKACVCPKVKCGPCQKKVSVGKIVRFCDWGEIQVCRKVVCENVNFYFGCLSKYEKGERETLRENASGEIEFLYDKEPKVRTKRGRSVASPSMARKARKDSISLETEGRVEVENDSRNIPGKVDSDVLAGQVAFASPKLQIFHRGQILKIKKKLPLFVGDEISNPDSKAQTLNIQFHQGLVEMKLEPKTRLIVEDPLSIEGHFQPFLYLVHGGCHFKVKFKEGSFDLLAGQVLTRTQQGSQRVNYEMDKEGLKVRVESLSHSIRVLKAQNLLSEGLKVSAGNFVSWVSETPGPLFSRDEKQALANEGFITPVFQMSESRKRELGLAKVSAPPQFADWSEGGAKKGRVPASMETGRDLCGAPSGQFQQCAWSCEGNPKGAKECQAERDSVQCVRRMCNAAGHWGAPTSFATSYRDLCPPSGVRVGDCSP